MTNPTYPGPETIQHTKLANGIEIYVYENFAAESVIIEGYLHAGALSEGRSRAGLADFTANMLMRGTQNHSFAAIYDILESIGASLDINAGRHVTDFSTTSLAEDFPLILELTAEALRRPIFPEEEFNQVMGETMTGFQIRENDTRQMAALKFREVLYGDHPYGYSSGGYAETVQSFRPADLAQFHQSHFGPQGMVIVIVGAIQTAAALDQVQAVFGDWQNDQWQAPPAVPAAPGLIGVNRIFHGLPEKSQSDIMMGWAGPERIRPDYMAASLTNTILGVFGMMGRLGKSVREEQGLAYYAYSRLQGGLGPAPWFINTGVAPDKVEQAIDSIFHEIRRIQEEPVTIDELADVKAYRTGSLPVSLETNDGLAGVIADMVLFDLGLDYLQRFPDIINNITREDIQAVAQKYLSPNDIAIAVVGPEEAGESN